MTKTLKQIQEENRKLILEAIHGVNYDEALEKELGFGCKILVERKYYSEGNTKFKWGEGLIVVDTSVYLDDINLKEGIIYTAKFGSEKIIEIIGKPLTLSRVLLVFSNKIFMNEISLQFPDYLQINRVNWDLTKETLEEQSEETQRGINELFND